MPTIGSDPDSASERRRKMIIAGTFFALSLFFLFWHLGRYALWDDEANTALIGEGVWHTGDTSAVVGQNIVAYRGGVELRNLKERYLPPFQYFVASPFVGLWPGSARAARFPFALCGLASVGLILYWQIKARAASLTLLVTSIAFAGNVSLWLYFRQCRYYALSVLLSIAIARLYFRGKAKPWTFPLLAALSIALLAANYMNYAALYGVIAFDWFVWSRKSFPISRRDAAWLFLPQIIVGGLIVTVWDPIGVHVNGDAGTALVDRLRLFIWAWRDLNRCEFAPLALLLAAPFVALFLRDKLLTRMFWGLFLYVLVVICLSPQNPALRRNLILVPVQLFDLRYLTAAIPLMIAVNVRTIVKLCAGRPKLAVIVSVIAFGTNILNGGGFTGGDARNKPAPLFRSSPLLYVNELLHTPGDPYATAVGWIDAHVQAGETIWVLPYHMVFPLMYHAPQYRYAWQIPSNPPPQLRGLPLFLYIGEELPDYVVCFGPDALRTLAEVETKIPMRYDRIETLDFYWHDFYRPEMAWRTFIPITDFNPDSEGIQIFRKSSQQSK